MTAKKDNLKDRVAIVTGSARAIGRSIAETLSDKGAIVVISDILNAEGEKTANEIGGKSIFIPCDISDPAQVKNLIDTAVNKFGRLDIMVNNAGINSGPDSRVTVDKYPEELWRKIIDIDLNGTFYCCKAAAEVMVKQSSGNIVNISSVAGVVALRLQIAFVAAKAGMIRMTEAMACELGGKGIRVNCVSPGSIFTEGTKTLFYEKESDPNNFASRLLSFVPQGRPGETKEIADAVAFLVSDEASYINGHNLIVDGGWTCGFNRDF